MTIDVIPESHRDAARSALAEVFGPPKEVQVQPVVGGASGALTYRIEVNAKPYLLRLETRRGPLRNPHQYTCMKIAADAGIAPCLHYANDSAGVAVLDFIDQRPLSDYPGGALGVATAVGRLAAQLQQTPAFPELADYRAILERMLGYLQRMFALGLLQPHADVLHRICAAYPWDSASHVSSHNDPNLGNILFDGQRLWLIDWETSYRNDPMTDIAILTENLAQTPELEEALLRSWLGRQPGQSIRARLMLMRRLTRLYYAGLLLPTPATTPAAPATTPAGEPITDLAVPTPAEFRAVVTTGQPKMGFFETKKLLGKMMLAGFLDGTQTEGFERALNEARDE
jgi:aminoglycoside phosphotransferase (APT) family kinase protein